jgi:hypothetical protein
MRCETDLMHAKADTPIRGCVRAGAGSLRTLVVRRTPSSRFARSREVLRRTLRNLDTPREVECNSPARAPRFSVKRIGTRVRCVAPPSAAGTPGVYARPVSYVSVPSCPYFRGSPGDPRANALVVRHKPSNPNPTKSRRQVVQCTRGGQLCGHLQCSAARDR